MAASNMRRFTIPGVVVGLALLSGCGGGRSGSLVTKANADKIQASMTEAEVAAILGNPTDSAEIALPGMAMPVGVSLPGGVELPKIELPKNAKLSNWRDGGKVIAVTFADGKVLASVYSDSTPTTVMQKQDADTKTAVEEKSAGLDDTPFTQTGGFVVIADQIGVVNFAIPYALAPNVELSGFDKGCVLITENKATGFTWKGVGQPKSNGEITWTAKGIKATKLPVGDGK